MAELTQDHLERAQAAIDAKHPVDSPDGLIFTEEILRTAAPFLQLPWDEPTEDEAKVIHSADLGMRLTATFDQLKWNILRGFVERRNAAMIPKPLDPRIDLIDRTLCGFMHSLNNTEGRTKAAKAILSALDEVK